MKFLRYFMISAAWNPYFMLTSFVTGFFDQKSATEMMKESEKSRTLSILMSSTLLECVWMLAPLPILSCPSWPMAVYLRTNIYLLK